MRTFKTDRQSPFSQQTYYKIEEVETICTDALRSIGLLPKKPEPIRIDRFIEKKFNITIDYDDIIDGVMGYTVFNKNGVEKVSVTKSFDKEGTKVAERRLRTTLAHEGGHCLLHTHLFCLEDEKTKPLFADYTESTRPKILCRDIDPEQKHYAGNWWEFQANMAIGGLLLPQHLVVLALNKILERSNMLKVKILPENKKEVAVNLCSEIFNVNPVVARIRIEKMWPDIKSGQLIL